MENDMRIEIGNVLKKIKKEIEINDYHASLRKEYGLDSLDLQLFFLNIEEKYNVKIENEETTQLDSIEQLTAWLSLNDQRRNIHE